MEVNEYIYIYTLCESSSHHSSLLPQVMSSEQMRTLDWTGCFLVATFQDENVDQQTLRTKTIGI
jgi:hypothetical protein